MESTDEHKTLLARPLCQSSSFVATKTEEPTLEDAEEESAGFWARLSPQACLDEDTLPASPILSEAAITLSLTLWLGALLVLFCLSRAWCIWAHIPSDCERQWSYFDLAENMSAISMYGVVLWCGTDLWKAGRMEYLKKHFYWLLPVAVATSPIFSLISQIPNSFSLSSSEGKVMPAGIVELVVVCIVFIALLCWHFLRCPRQDLPLYLMQRLGVGALVGVCALLVVASGGQLRVHHYFLGFYLGLFAKFNHPVSTCVLAVCVGLFIQGISAYNPVGLFQRGPCYSFTRDAQRHFSIHNDEYSPSDPYVRTSVTNMACSVQNGMNRAQVCLDGYSSSVLCRADQGPPKITPAP